MKYILTLALILLVSAGCMDVEHEPAYLNDHLAVPTASYLDHIEPNSNFGETGATNSDSTTINDCDPNYTGCVPIASDVDCAGGSGNGPAYVQGPVTVIGYDKYGLDRGDDGIGCE